MVAHKMIKDRKTHGRKLSCRKEAEILYLKKTTVTLSKFLTPADTFVLFVNFALRLRAYTHFYPAMHQGATSQAPTVRF